MRRIAHLAVVMMMGMGAVAASASAAHAKSAPPPVPTYRCIQGGGFPVEDPTSRTGRSCRGGYFNGRPVFF